MKNFLYVLLFSLPIAFTTAQEHSVARKWNEVLLEAIRGDFARPTVHARNLFHVSGAMYDTWAVFDEEARPYLLGKTVGGFQSSFAGFTPAAGAQAEEAISYAAFRIIRHRFIDSPGAFETTELANALFITELGYDASFTSTDYSSGSAAALGNYIAAEYIAFGLQDGSNEEGDYENQFYFPINEPLNAESPGNPALNDPNRWQPLAFDVFIDQSGNEIPGAIPDFLSPEWGQVTPFALKTSDLTVYERGGFDYLVYHDPGPPPYLDPENGTALSDLYQWGFSMVAVWSGQLDPETSESIDISPAALGNLSLDEMPTAFEDYDQFYKYLEGGDPGQGYELNPVTGQPYEPQVVKMGDYGRVLAEFWADGPDSETPPGHWFTILNYVNDHPDLVKKFGGEGELLDELEWDVKSYFILAGAMHDVAIAAWGIKGYYDYIRPISAIRYLAEKGQSSDESLPNYDAAGIPLVAGHIELVGADDPLVGSANEHLNKIKLWAWKGPDFIEEPETDVAGVDWILAENWWPYQRPSFITPPFAGYISGHSTYSRAAAEVLTLLTGDAYFPGGIGEFEAPMNEFLVFEEGPSEDIVLQWATYRDASDQCSLSRIWGGIHPPADDLPGRRIGERIGIDAFGKAVAYFTEVVSGLKSDRSTFVVYPNPTSDRLHVDVQVDGKEFLIRIVDLNGKLIKSTWAKERKKEIDLSAIEAGSYLVLVSTPKWQTARLIIVK